MCKKVLLTATVQSHIAQFHKPLIAILKEQGYEVHVAARDNLAEKNGLQIDNVDKIYDIPFSRSPKSRDNITAYMKLKRLIDENKYEIVHCNTPMGGIVTRLAAKAARRNGTKVFYTAHGFHFYKGAPRKNWMIYYPIEKYFSRFTDRLITITKEDYKLASERFNKTKVFHMHGVGVSSERFYPVSDIEMRSMREKMELSDDEFVCLCTGELNKNKNQRFIIEHLPELIKKIPNLKVLFAGNGPNEQMLRQRVNELDVNAYVDFLGYTTKLSEYAKCADIIISVSKREGMPLNIIEAMMCGKPVVASINRGHRELIQDGINGFLVDLNGTDDFNEKVYKLYSDKALYTKVKENELQSVMPYTQNEVIKELKKIYSD